LGGGLSTAYDPSGALMSLAVGRKGQCLPGSANCSQRFVYDWDEVGRLVRARRWDQASAGSAGDPTQTGTPSADLSYLYDASDQRTLKAATDSLGNQRFSARIFSTLELRRAAAEGNDYQRDATTEVAYLDSNG